MKKFSIEKIIISNSCLMLVIGLFSIDLCNPSLPAITKELNVNQTIARSLGITYLLGFGVSQLFYGPLSDKYGRRKIILSSLVLAGLGNVFTAFAVNETQLLIWRLITGFGTGGCPVISRAILTDTFKDKIKLTQAFSVFAAASQISPTFAPIIGGLIQEHFSWRPNFIILAVLCLIALFIIFSTLPETAFLNKSNKDNQIIKIITNYKSIIVNKFFMFNCIMSALIFSYTIAYFTTSPFVFQNEFSLSPFWNGALYSFYSFGIVLGTRLIKPLTNKYLPEKIVYYAILALCFITISMFLMQLYLSHIAVFLSYTTIIAFLCGISAPILLSLSMYSFSHLGGSASAIQGTVKMVGTALILSILLKIPVSNSIAMTKMFFWISISLMLFLLLNTSFNLFKRNHQQK